MGTSYMSDHGHFFLEQNGVLLVDFMEPESAYVYSETLQNAGKQLTTEMGYCHQELFSFITTHTHTAACTVLIYQL